MINTAIDAVNAIGIPSNGTGRHGTAWEPIHSFIYSTHLPHPPHLRHPPHPPSTPMAVLINRDFDASIHRIYRMDASRFRLINTTIGAGLSMPLTPSNGTMWEWIHLFIHPSPHLPHLPHQPHLPHSPHRPHSSTFKTQNSNRKSLPVTSPPTLTLTPAPTREKKEQAGWTVDVR